MIRIILDRMAVISTLAIALVGFALLQDALLQSRSFVSNVVVDTRESSASLYYHAFTQRWEKNSFANRTVIVR